MNDQKVQVGRRTRRIDPTLYWLCIPTSKFELCLLERWSSRLFGRVWSPNLYQTGEPDDDR